VSVAGEDGRRESVHCRYCSRIQTAVVDGAKIVEKVSDADSAHAPVLGE